MYMIARVKKKKEKVYNNVMYIQCSESVVYSLEKSKKLSLFFSISDFFFLRKTDKQSRFWSTECQTDTKNRYKYLEGMNKTHHDLSLGICFLGVAYSIYFLGKLQLCSKQIAQKKRSLEKLEGNTQARNNNTVVIVLYLWEQRSWLPCRFWNERVTTDQPDE